MNIWIINPYGPIPSEGWRQYRFALIGEVLASQGHVVTWWTANFSHHFKRFRSTGWQDVPILNGFSLRLVPTTPYSTNTSWHRLRFEANFVRSVLRRAGDYPRPNLLVSVDPPQTIGWLATRLKSRFSVPLVLDVMDMWPELFHLAFPPRLRRFARPVLFPFYALRQANLSQADGVTALCQTYMDLALTVAPLLRQRPSAVIFNGVDLTTFSRPSLPTPDLPISKPPGAIWAIYAGSLGTNYDVDTVLTAGLALAGSNIRLLIAGDGPRRRDVVRFIEAHPSANLSYLGKLDHQDLVRLYRACDIGICPYRPESNVAMPDKAYDYMAAGLPMVNSLRGELSDLLRHAGAGLSYEAGDSGSLCDALLHLAAEETQRHSLAQNSRALATEFDSKRQYLNYFKFVDALLAGG